MTQKKKWIQVAIKKKGALRKTASKEGALKDGIAAEWLEKTAKRKGVTGKRARLAKIFKGLPRRKK